MERYCWTFQYGLVGFGQTRKNGSVPEPLEPLGFVLGFDSHHLGWVFGPSVRDDINRTMGFRVTKREHRYGTSSDILSPR